MAARSGRGVAALAALAAGAGAQLDMGAIWPCYGASPTMDSTSVYARSGSKGSKTMWRVNTGDKVAAGPAISAEGVAYVGNYAGHFYAFDTTDGTQLWKTKVRYGVGISGAALSVDGDLYFGVADHDDGNKPSDEVGYFYKLRADSGEVVWRKKTGGVYSSPMIGDDGVVYVGSVSEEALYAYEPDGSLKWKVDLGSAVYDTPLLSKSTGDIYVGGGNVAWRLRPSDGGTVWSYTANDLTNGCLATTADGTEVWIYSSHKGTLTARDVDTGAKVWKYTLDDDCNNPPSLSLDHEVVYVGDHSKKLYAVNATSGALVWTAKTKGEVTYSKAAVNGDGVIFIGDESGYINAISARGERLWTKKLKEYVESGPSIDANGDLVVGDNAGYLYKINGASSDDDAAVEDGFLSFSALDVDAVAGAGRWAPLAAAAAVCAGLALGARRRRTASGEYRPV